MNENVKKYWLPLLRSGELKKTTGALQGENGYCCLGVGVITYERATGNQLERDSEGVLIGGALYGCYEEVREWLGLVGEDGEYYGGSLVNHNDDQGLDLMQIADVIESEPEGLFLEDSQ